MVFTASSSYSEQMKPDGFSVYASLPRAALTSYYYFLEEAALHIAGFQSPHYVLFTAVWQRNKLER